MDMTVMDFIDKAGNTGVMLLLLALFAFYILQKARTDDKRVADAQEASRQAIADTYADAQEKIEQAWIYPAGW